MGEIFEIRQRLAADVTHLLAQFPREMSLARPTLLASESREELQEYEKMYRHLYDQLREVFVRYVPALSIPAFDEFLDAGHTMDASRRLKRALHTVQDYLPAHLYVDVVGNFELLSTFADMLREAKFLQDRLDDASSLVY